MDKRQTARIKLIISTFAFGTIGLFVRGINMSSAGIACARGIIGALFLLAWILLRGRRPDGAAIKKNLRLLIISGVCISLNWIMLFEAYNYTTVAVATLCYYMAPIIVIAVSPFVFKEKMTLKKLICMAAALVGMFFVSGAAENGGAIGDVRGVLLGLGAAALYACAILLNKHVADIDAFDKTVIQLGTAGVILVPYCLATGAFAAASLDVTGIILLAVVCIVHTGICYCLYFGSMDALPSHSIALISYVDPVVAVLLSAVVLKEGLSLLGGLGAIMVIAAAMISEME